jgi:hypothetical protein
MTAKDDVEGFGRKADIGNIHGQLRLKTMYVSGNIIQPGDLLELPLQGRFRGNMEEPLGRSVKEGSMALQYQPGKAMSAESIA